MRPGKIISGGQSGVDRAALDFAIERGIPWGGWAVDGWRAEDGTIPERYREHMHECGTRDYRDRTDMNIRTSEATLIIARRDTLDRRGKFTGGTLLTARYAKMSHRPIGWAFVDDAHAADRVGAFVDSLTKGQPIVLNIAGPRESKAPGIYAATLALLREVWP